MALLRNQAAPLVADHTKEIGLYDQTNGTEAGDFAAVAILRTRWRPRSRTT